MNDVSGAPQQSATVSRAGPDHRFAWKAVLHREILTGRYRRRTSAARSELGDSVDVAVGVLEPGQTVVAQLGNPLLVRLDRITVVLLETDAVGGELVHRLFEVIHLPAGDRAARLARVVGRGVDVNLAAPAARVRDPAVADIPASREAELALVELLRLLHVRHRYCRLNLCVTQTHLAPICRSDEILVTQPGCGSRTTGALGRKAATSDRTGSSPRRRQRGRAGLVELRRSSRLASGWLLRLRP